MNEEIKIKIKTMPKPKAKTIKKYPEIKLINNGKPLLVKYSVYKKPWI